MREPLYKLQRREFMILVVGFISLLGLLTSGVLLVLSYFVWKNPEFTSKMKYLAGISGIVLAFALGYLKGRVDGRTRRLLF